MKIAIPSEGKNITDPVDVRFGRCRGFVIYDTGSGSASYIENVQNTEAVQGAGIQAAKTIIDSGAEILISGNVGPKAFSALSSAGIKIYLCGRTSVKDALEDLNKGRLEAASGASVEGHW
jgi:predicted Fe-Mo cluster-binding NifX family protein